MCICLTCTESMRWSSCWIAFTWKPEEVRKTLEVLRPRDWKCAEKIGEDDILKHDVEIYTLLRLIRAALHPDAGQTVELDAECDVEKLASIIVRQSLVTLVYPVIKRQTADGWQPTREKLKPVYEQEIHKGLVQEYEIQTLLDDMEKDGIDCLPMKGWIMRNYYPDPLMRSMCDLDVLLREMDSEKMRQWMEARKYTFENDVYLVHDEYMKPPYMCVELHRYLIDPEIVTKQILTWVNQLQENIWNTQLLIKDKQHIYQLGNEDFYIYYLLHLYKHFMSTGAGIRPIIDMYMLSQKEKNLDVDYITRQLELLDLEMFAHSIENFSKTCFDRDSLVDDIEPIILEYLLSSGVHGDQKTQQMTKFVRENRNSLQKSILSRQIKRCFPVLQIMQKQYPVLYSYPWLLPVFWGVRAVHIARFERQKIKHFNDNTKGVLQHRQESSYKYDLIKQAFELLGIRK